MSDREPTYRVVAREPTATHAPGDVIADFENAKNIGYSSYLNDVGEAFVTINQDDPKALALRDWVDADAHINIYRDTDLMWGGWLGEMDETDTDFICYAHSYESTLFWLHTAWETEYVSSQINTIIQDLWNDGQAKSESMTQWMTDGTFEAPVTTSGGGTPINLALYKASYKRLLFAMQELVALSISDTTNRVIFEITPSGTFNLWKNKGLNLTDIRWSYGGGSIIGYRRYRVPADRRNVLLSVGSSPKDLVLRDEEGTPPAGEGRREEAIYLPWVRDADELDRIAKLRLVRAKRVDSELSLVMAPGTVIPARATNSSYELGDAVPVYIKNGVTDIDGLKLVTGQQVVVYRGKEHVRPLLQDTGASGSVAPPGLGMFPGGSSGGGSTSPVSGLGPPHY